MEERETTEQMLERVVKVRVNELERILDGDVFVCDECLEEVEEDCEVCPHCGSSTVDPREKVFVDYVERETLGWQTLELITKCFPRQELLGVRIQCCCGGPGIWIDTDKGVIEGSWGFDVKRARLEYEYCQRIDEEVAEVIGWEGDVL